MKPAELQGHISQWGWFHEIDLGHEVFTRPAVTSLGQMKSKWAAFTLNDLRGKSVLDIGGMDGGFAFMAEAVGATDVAVLDHYIWATDSHEYDRVYRESINVNRTPPAPHESAWHPDTLPSRVRFDTAKNVLKSKVRAIPLDFMDCNLAEVGQWDVVLYLGVLYHMMDPIGALRRVRAVTREQAIIETEACFVPNHPDPLWQFFPDGRLNNDRTNWWVPNIEALIALTSCAGFGRVDILAGEPEDGKDETFHYRAIVRACP
jgi:tRNA (mo5U34)-methyltransferase